MKCDRCKRELTKEDGDWEEIVKKFNELGIAFNLKLQCPDCFKITKEESEYENKINT